MVDSLFSMSASLILRSFSFCSYEQFSLSSKSRSKYCGTHFFFSCFKSYCSYKKLLPQKGIISARIPVLVCQMWTLSQGLITPVKFICFRYVSFERSAEILWIWVSQFICFCQKRPGCTTENKLTLEFQWLNFTKIPSLGQWAPLLHSVTQGSRLTETPPSCGWAIWSAWLSRSSQQGKRARTGTWVFTCLVPEVILLNLPGSSSLAPRHWRLLFSPSQLSQHHVTCSDQWVESNSNLSKQPELIN